MATSAARIGVPAWSRARRWGASEEPPEASWSLVPGSGAKVGRGAGAGGGARLVPGRGPESRQRRESGGGQGGQRRHRRGDAQGAPSDTGLLEPAGDDPRGCRARFLAAADRVPLLDRFVIGHQRLGPVDRGRADEEDREDRKSVV